MQGIVGMVHVGALPGTPRASASPAEVVAAVVSEARTLEQAGFDAIIIENMHDRPYLRDGIGPEITACMTAVGAAVRAAVSVPIGIQVLGGGAFEALAVAHATGLDFVRCENFVFSHVADEGLMDRALAGPLLRYRRAIGADRVMVVADIKKKHASHALTADLDVAAFARAAEFFLADAVVVTGTETGAPVSMDDLRRTRAATTLPVLVGSGADPSHVGELLGVADAVIVGSWIKVDGDWTKPVDPARAAEFVRAAKQVGAGSARTASGAPNTGAGASPTAPGMDSVRKLFARR